MQNNDLLIPSCGDPAVTKRVIADKAALSRVGAMVRQRLAADPAVYRVPVEAAELFAIGSFLSAAECAGMIALVDRVAKPSTAFDVDYVAGYRTSYSGDVDRAESLARIVERRICDLLGVDESWGEAIQGQRYLPGQEFRPHWDWFNTAAPHWRTEARTGGQRSWTAMAFLNDVEEGGETHFTSLGISITPQAGALLVWNNALPDGRPNPDTKHAGTPVVRGVKYVVTKWFRTRPWG